MKYISKILFIVVAILTMVSCVDEKALEFNDFSRPLTVEDVNYLRSFDVLKSYIEPNFNLGAQTSISSFTDKGVNYRLLTSDFNQISMNDEMMHGTVVSSVGAYSFGNVPGLLAAAKDAEMPVFGRSLVWHSLQSGAYLRSLLADSLEINMILIPGTDDSGEKLVNGNFANDTWNTSFKTNGALSGSLTGDGEGPNGKGRALKVNVPTVQANAWQAQMIVVWDLAMDEGETWTFKMDYKTDAACSFGNQAQRGLGNYMFGNIVPSLNSTSSWQHLESKIETASKHVGCKAIAFDLGFNATNYYFANISLVKEAVITPIEQIANGNLKEDKWDTNIHQNGALTASLTADGDGPYGKGRALAFKVATAQDAGWKAQMILSFDAMEEGQTWEFSMDYKADMPCTFGNQAQIGFGGYQWGGFVPDAKATTAWQTLKYTINTVAKHNGINHVAFDLGLNATTYYFGNISLVYMQQGVKDKWVPDTIRHQKPPEVKIAIITGEFDKWIKNVMTVTGGAIKDWDIVNEPMDNAKPTEVRSGVGRTLADNEFYWQDYLGGKDYARTAVKLARDYGGNGLKLFVNETGLNDNLLKCDGLKKMVTYWESDGKTKIDGIGAQLNLSYSLDPQTQILNETNIANMFTSLKATNKLIRISQLDMVLKDKSGATINTANVTREQQLLMSKYYNYVIRKYMEIIPAAQRYGVTLNNVVESTTNVGLWDGVFERKFTFSGFANGLAGKEFDK